MTIFCEPAVYGKTRDNEGNLWEPGIYKKAYGSRLFEAKVTDFENQKLISVKDTRGKEFLMSKLVALSYVRCQDQKKAKKEFEKTLENIARKRESRRGRL